MNTPPRDSCADRVNFMLSWIFFGWVFVVGIAIGYDAGIHHWTIR